MPHLRPRYAASRVKKVLQFSAITGLLGQRQVGKTTLLEQASAEYVTFDREKVLLQAKHDAEVFLSGRKAPFGIDEAQLCPEIFPAAKELVRQIKVPGQIILSGSVRFTSRKAIRESLTGRIVNIEVLPFTRSEAYQEPLTSHIEACLSSGSEKNLVNHFSRNEKVTTEKIFRDYLDLGGLPGICFFRERSIRNDKMQSHIDTLLNRDIQLVYPTSLPYTSLRALLEFLANVQGVPFDLKEAAFASQISTVTLKKVLYAFEALFLIRPVTSIGDEKKTVYFLEDQGFASWLKESTLENKEDIIRGLYANLRQEFHYQPDLNGKILQYRTKHGAFVPLVFKSPKGMLGVIATLDRTPAPKTIGSATSFLKAYPDAKVVIAYAGQDIVFKDKRHFWVPFNLLI